MFIAIKKSLFTALQLPIFQKARQFSKTFVKNKQDLSSIILYQIIDKKNLWTFNEEIMKITR